MANNYDCIIDVPSAILYTNPDKKSSMADEALYGMSCKIISEELDFYKIEMFYGYSAFVDKKEITNGKMGSDIICTSFSDLLPTPEYRYAPVMTLPKGSRIQTGKTLNERFIEVYLGNGTILYTHLSNIKKYRIIHPAELQHELVKKAKEYSGSTYRWGGKSPSGIDCSGLTFMSYYLNGYIIYRDADREEFKNFKKISLEKAKPGDLLFFPGHIGLYIGNGEFIHSTAAFGGVLISSLLKDSPLFSRIHSETLQAVMTLFF